MQTKKLFLVSLSLASLVLSANCAAQYVWINERGTKQYSDQPPPKNIPKDKILKAPGFHNKTVEETLNTTKVSSDGEKNDLEKLQKPNTLASKNEEFNKRKIAREDAEKKAEAERQASIEKQKNCIRAKSYQLTIESGTPIATRDQNGERVILDENQRAKELADAKKVLSECN